MEDLGHFNAALQYIEEHLDGDLSDLAIQRITGCPASLFGRVFSVLSGMPLGEYLRLRKLSLAAYDLRQTELRVLDIALKYGYASENAFSAAFKRFHGISPRAARQTGAFKILPPIHFTLHTSGGDKMEIRMEKGLPFSVAGINLRGKAGDEFSGLWHRLFSKYDMRQLNSLGNGQSYGVCSFMDENNAFDYMAGVHCTDPDKAKAMGLDVVTLPEANYAVLGLKGPMPECIREGWTYFMETFAPQQGLRHAGTPDFELYADGDMRSPDYRMELWVPVAPANG